MSEPHFDRDVPNHVAEAETDIPSVTCTTCGRTWFTEDPDTQVTHLDHNTHTFN